jgi:hypothetical protein
MKETNNLQQTQPLQQIAIVRSFLEEMSKKYKCPIDQIMIGIGYNEMHILRYDKGANQVWKQLEIISF